MNARHSNTSALGMPENLVVVCLRRQGIWYKVTSTGVLRATNTPTRSTCTSNPVRTRAGNSGSS
eukprot:3426852-Rhodomonas_salina.2